MDGESRIPMVVGCAVATACTVWLMWGIWDPGIPSGADMGAQVLRADFALDRYSRGRVDGWHTAFGLGYQAFLFLGPGFDLLVGVAKLASLGQLDTLGAFKLTLVYVYAAQHVAVAVLCRALGSTYRAAGIAALLSLTVSSGMGGAGLLGLFGAALVSQAAATPAVLLCLAGLVRLMRAPSRPIAVATGLSAAFVVITHVVSVLLLGVLGLSLLLAIWLDARIAGRAARSERAGLPARVRALALAAWVAGTASAFVAVPMVAHRDLRGEITFFPDAGFGARLVEVADGTFLFRPMVATAICLGFVYAVVRARERALGAVVPPLVVGVGLGALWAVQRVGGSNPATVQLPNRAWGLVGLIAVLPLASAVDRGMLPVRALVGREPRRGGGRRRAWLVDAAPDADFVIGLGVAVLLVVLPAGLGRELASTASPTSELLHVAGELYARVPPEGRFAVQRSSRRELEVAGVLHPDFWLAATSTRDVLNIFNPESSFAKSPVFAPDRISDRPTEQADLLSGFGVTHLVVLVPEDLPSLVGSDRFSVVWQEGSIRLLEVRPAPDQPPPVTKVRGTRPIAADTTFHDDEHLTIITTTVGGPPTDVRVAIAYSPKWHAWREGAEVPIWHSPEGLISFQAASGTSATTLTYRSDGWDHLGRGITGMGALLGVGRWVRGRPRERSADSPVLAGDTCEGLWSEH